MLARVEQRCQRLNFGLDGASGQARMPVLRRVGAVEQGLEQSGMAV